MKKKHDLCSTQEDRQKNAQDCAFYDKMLLGNSSSNDDSSCQSRKNDLIKAENELTAACGALGLPSDVGNCAAKKTACNEYRKSSAGQSSSSSDPTSFDKNKAEKLASYCPDMAAADQEKFEKDLEKTQDRVKALKDKIPELEDAVTQAQSDMADKQSSAEEEMQKEASEYSKQLKDASKELSDQQQQLQQQLVQQQAAIAQLQAQLAETNSVSSAAATIKYNEAKRQTEINCVNYADSKVAGEQAKALDDYRFGRGYYAHASAQSIFSEVGGGSQKHWRDRTSYYLAICRGKPTYAASNASAFDNYKGDLKTIAAKKESLRGQIQSQQAALAQISNGQGCTAQPMMAANGLSGETAVCKALREANENMAQIKADHRTKSKQLARKKASTLRAAQAKLKSKNDQLTRANGELKKEQARLDNLKSYLGMRLNNGSSGGKEEAKALWAAFAKWNTAASAFDSSCYSDTTSMCNTSGFSADCSHNGSNLKTAGLTTSSSSPSLAPANNLLTNLVDDGGSSKTVATDSDDGAAGRDTAATPVSTGAATGTGQ
jgi:hypothetical protein